MDKDENKITIQSEEMHTDPALTTDEAEEAIQQESDAGESEPSRPTLKEVIEENAREDEQPSSSSFTLRKILGGDILNTDVIRKQIWLILLIATFAVLYISNRYSCQQRQVEIHKLTTKLNKLKYKTLSTTSMLTERSRESHIQELLRANNDTLLHISDQPPFVIFTDGQK